MKIRAGRLAAAVAAAPLLSFGQSTNKTGHQRLDPTIKLK